MVDFADMGGFDILSRIEGENLAVALLNVIDPNSSTGAMAGLYIIDLVRSREPLRITGFG